MADVFISYSRRDSEFVRTVHRALAERGRDVWIDWEDIPVTADWWQEICLGIEQADSFVFVVSKNSLLSPICHFEVAHAAATGKRVVPVVRDDPDEALIEQMSGFELDENASRILADRDLREVGRGSWQVLARHNWLFFKEDDQFDVTFDRLVNALDTDLDYVRAHTNLLTRALQWERREKDVAFLLTGTEITEAEAWLANAGEKEPSPTDLHREYITTSRKDENRRTRLLRALQAATIGFFLIGIISVVTLVIALSEASEAERRAADADDLVATSEMQIADADDRVAVSENAIGTAWYQATQITENVAQAENRLEALELAAAAESALSAADANPNVAMILATRSLQQEYTPNAVGAINHATRRDTLATHAFTKEGAFIWCMDWHADNEMLVAGTLERDNLEVAAFEIWSTDEQVVSIPLEGVTFVNGPCIVRWSPDGTRFASATIDILGTDIEIWDVNGQLLGTFDLPSSISEPQLVWHPNGDYLLILNEGQVTLFDGQTAELAHEYPQAGRVIVANWSPDGSAVALGMEDGTVALWNPDGDDPIREWQGHAGGVSDVVWAPDGSQLATRSSVDSIKIWEPTRNEDPVVLDFDDTWASFAWSTDGTTLVTASSEVMLWDADTGTWFASYDYLESLSTNSVQWHPHNNWLLTVSWDALMVYDLSQNEVLFQLSDTSFAETPHWSTDGQYLVLRVGIDEVHLLEIEPSVDELASRDESGPIRQVVWDGEGQRLVTVQGTQAIVWDVSTREALTIPLEFGGFIRVVAWSPSNDALAIGDLGIGVQVWDAITGELLWDAVDIGDVQSLSWQDDRLAVSTWEGGVSVWQDGALIQEWANLVVSDEIEWIGEDLVVAGVPQGARFDVETGEQIATPTTGIRMTALPTQDRIIGFGADGELVVIEPEVDADPLILTPAIRHFSFVNVMSVHENRMVTGDASGTAIIWDLDTFEALFQLQGHTAVITAANWHPSGDFVVTGSEDGLAIVWDAETGHAVQMIDDQRNTIIGVGWDSTGELLMTADADRVILTPFDPTITLVEWACARLPRDLTSLERGNYGIDNTPTCQE